MASEERTITVPGPPSGPSVLWSQKINRMGTPLRKSESKMGDRIVAALLLARRAGHGVLTSVVGILNDTIDSSEFTKSDDTAMRCSFLAQSVSITALGTVSELRYYPNSRQDQSFALHSGVQTSRRRQWRWTESVGNR
jgi:hypothetical protein